MNSIRMRLVVASLAGFLAECGPKAETAAPTRTVEYDRLFPSTDNWGPTVRYRVAARAGRNQIDSVTASPGGDVCYVVREQAIESRGLEQSSWHSYVECKSANGATLLRRERAGNGVIKDLAFAPDGRLAIAELVEAPTTGRGRRFFLRMALVSPRGEELESQLLYDPPTDDELLYYELAFNEEIVRSCVPTLTHDNKPVLMDPAEVKLLWHGGSLFLLAYTYGVKVYRLSDTLESIWDVQAMPAHTWLWAAMLQASADLAIGKSGELFVAFEVYAAEAQAYEMHFGRSLNMTDDQRDIAVAVYDDQGEFQRVHLLGKAEHSEALVGIAHRDGSLWLGAQTRRTKFDSPNDTTEWDLLLMEAAPDDGTLRQFHLIDNLHDDMAYEFLTLPNDNFLFAGATGFIQVDTNSQVTDASGLLLEVSPSGEPQRSVVLEGPRNVVVRSASLLKENCLLFSGVFDGPITHTCEQDEALCHKMGFVGLSEM